MAKGLVADWVVVADSFGYKNSVVDSATGKMIASTKTYHHSADEMAKHANLISASPELYISLLSAKWILENGGTWTIEDQVNMNKALQKATGK